LAIGGAQAPWQVLTTLFVPSQVGEVTHRIYTKNDRPFAAAVGVDTLVQWANGEIRPGDYRSVRQRGPIMPAELSRK